MTMRLTRPTVLPTIEEREQASRVTIRSLAAPFFQTLIRKVQVVLLKFMCLLLVAFRRKYEMICNDWILIEHNDMRGITSRHTCDQEIFWGIFERVNLYTRRLDIIILSLRLLP
jgi:hypothetical protein